MRKLEIDLGCIQMIRQLRIHGKGFLIDYLKNKYKTKTPQSRQFATGG